MSVSIVDETEDHIDVSITDDGRQPAGVISDGMWWVRDRRGGEMTIISVYSRGKAEGLEPDDDDYGVVMGYVMGKDYPERVYDLRCPVHGLMHWYEFVCLIEQPHAEFVEKSAKAGGEPGHQRQKAPEWFDWSAA